jgi:hypothetical protein
MLDHVIPFNEEHLRRLLGEYINQYYNSSRTYQGNGRQTPIISEEPEKTAMAQNLLNFRSDIGWALS